MSRSTDTDAVHPGVGIVVVSHSRPLARAAVALAAEMVHGRSFRVAVAAGLDETTFGTDAVQIKTAIQAMDGPDGVVVLMDLGSAVLSTELALDLLEDRGLRSRVVLCPAPLVEGLVVAAVAAAGGAGAAEVAAEARDALMGKTAHLSATAGQAPPPGPDDPAAVVADFTVHNEHGLHARPAARLVAEVRRLDATVRLRNLTTGSGLVPGSSLSRVATLAALRGHRVQVQAAGPQAHEAVEHVLALAARRFDEPDDGAPPPARQPGRPDAVNGAVAQGSAPLGASPGIGIGPVRRIVLEPVRVDRDADAGSSPSTQWRRVVEAVAEVRLEVERLRVLTAREVGSAEAGIFDAHLMLLGDTELLADVKRDVELGKGAAASWSDAMADVERQWAALPDPYLRARAEDVRAVGDQVLRALTGSRAASLAAAGIVVARELAPADVAELDPALVHGLVLAGGSPTSHAAILARAQGIPAVVCAGPSVLTVSEGTTIVVDGTTGEIVVDPPPAVLARFRAAAADLARTARLDLEGAAGPAMTRDGAVIEVAANIGSVADARAACAAGADSVGLLRTEFGFLGRDRAPSAAEQEHEYCAVAGAMRGRRITIRTLDVGGDKPLPYLALPAEENPFLGLRGIRLALARPDLLADQLVAVCRTATKTPVDVMFPMVATPDELVRCRAALAAAAGPSGLPPGMRVGIMVEVPSAALTIESFLPHLDFVSIGTNDLTQYTLAAERGNPSVAHLADSLEPAVLRLVAGVCRAAAGRVPVAVCGEAASDPAAIAVLLGLGVTELSVSPHAVPGVKRVVRELDVAQCADLAARALDAGSAARVRDLVAASQTPAGVTRTGAA